MSPLRSIFWSIVISLSMVLYGGIGLCTGQVTVHPKSSATYIATAQNDHALAFWMHTIVPFAIGILSLCVSVYLLRLTKNPNAPRREAVIAALSQPGRFTTNIPKPFIVAVLLLFVGIILYSAAH